MSILIDNITYDIEDEDLPDIEYYEILTIDELIKDNPTFIAFSREEIFNELYDFFKDSNKSDAIADLFFKDSKLNIINYVFVADASKKNYQCFEEDIESFVNSVNTLTKLQYKVGQKEKNKFYFALTYDDQSARIRLKPHMKTTIELRDDNLHLNLYYPVFESDDTNVPIMAAYYKQPTTTSHDYIADRVIADHIDKKYALLNYVDSESYSDIDKLLKIVKPKMKTILDSIKVDSDSDANLDQGYLDAVLHRFDTSLDDINMEDFAMLKTYMQEQVDAIKESKIKHKHFKIRPTTVSNDKIEFYNRLHNVKTLYLQFSDKMKEDYQVLINALNEEKMNINAPPLIYNNINDIVNGVLSNDISLEEIIENLGANRNVLIIDHAIRTLKSISENQVEDITGMLEHLTQQFGRLKNTLDIFKFHFLDFYADVKEIKEANDYSEYEGIPDIYKNDGNYEGMAMEEEEDEIDENIISTMDTYNKDKYSKYWLSIKYKDAIGFTEMLQVLLPLLDRLQDYSKLSFHFDMLCDELFKKHAGLPTKYHIMQEILQAGDIKLADEYIRDIVKITPTVALNAAASSALISSDLAQYVQRCNRTYVENLHSMVYTSIAWLALRAQEDIIHKNLIFDENDIMIAYVDKWSLDGVPVRDSKQGVLIYLSAIIEDIINEEPTNITNTAKTSMRLIETDYKDVLEHLRNKLKGVEKRQNKGTESYMSLLETFKNKQKDKLLNDYVNALLYMPSHKFKKIHKILLGCCLQQIGKNFVPDSDILGAEKKGLIAAKKLYAKKRETNKSRYALYVPYSEEVEDEQEEPESFIPISDLELEDSETSQSLSLESWLETMKDASPLLPNYLIELFQREGTKGTQAGNAEMYTKHYIQCFCKTAGHKSQDFESTFFGYLKNHKNIFNILSSTYKMYPAATPTESTLLLNASKSLNEMKVHLDALSHIADQYNIQDIKRIKDLIIARALCLPFNPDIARNNILYASVEVSNAFASNLIKHVYTTVNKYMVGIRMPTAEENTKFINSVREQNKIKTLSLMNTKTQEERNLMMSLKKIGLQYQEDNDDQVQQADEWKDAGYVGGEDDANEREFMMQDQEEYDDDNLDFEEYGFIYS